MEKFIKGSLAVTVALLVGVGAAAASGSPQNPAPTPVGPAAFHLVALDDPTIAAIFDAANTADIETGELAVKLGNSEDVRKFGAMLMNDHKMVRQLDRDLVRKLGVTLTPPKPDQGAIDHAAAMKKLGALKGAAFDHAFLQHEVAFHAAVLDAVKTTLMPAIQNAELKALVVKVAPAFQGHMIAAQTMDKKLFPNGRAGM